MINKLILGDNYDILRGMDDESVDLIYLDPPFFRETLINSEFKPLTTRTPRTISL
jgi:predicted methyltransferase